MAIRGRCASFTVLTATVSEIFGGQTTPSFYFSSIDGERLSDVFSGYRGMLIVICYH